MDDTIPAAVIIFRLRERHYKLYVPLPKPTDDAIRYMPAKHEPRSPEARQRAPAQAERVRWRAVAGYIKMTLEAVESGIIPIEQAFLAATLLPDGSTLGQWAAPQVEEAYREGRMPQALPGMGALQLGPG